MNNQTGEDGFLSGGFPQKSADSFNDDYTQEEKDQMV